MLTTIITMWLLTPAAILLGHLSAGVLGGNTRSNNCQNEKEEWEKQRIPFQKIKSILLCHLRNGD